MTVEINQIVNDFSAPTTSDKQFQLADFYNKKNVILYFYPRDNTPGCTTESIDFSTHYADFLASDTVIFGVSRDSLKSHENFKKKYDFPFELISDPDEVVCHLFDVIKLKKMYGKEHLGIERSTFLINKSGVLVQAWRKVKV
ncbi:MAG TPA: peroxiredoxin, partial [Thiothrix sp.]|nr:peroxiredoxin [Thiothrix sp.]